MKDDEPQKKSSRRAYVSGKFSGEAESYMDGSEHLRVGLPNSMRMKKPPDPGGSCLLPASKSCSWQFLTHPSQLHYGSFSAPRKMLNFDSAECKTEDFEIILPASVSSRDLRCTVTLQFETDTMMVVAQAQTRPAAVALFRTQVNIPASFSINGNQVSASRALQALNHGPCLRPCLEDCNLYSFKWWIQQQRMGLALLVFVLPVWFFNRLTSFCLLILLVVCGDISFSSIYSWFIGKLILLVVRMYWGVAVPRFAFLSLASVYCFGLSMICCWFWALEFYSNEDLLISLQKDYTQPRRAHDYTKSTPRRPCERWHCHSDDPFLFVANIWLYCGLASCSK
ncbi:hypothetical protein Cgig2_031982 [Carnegiea gigantea]|uniref:Uncharacterized protein n=1 Tax=Carnegiea gigantea TaxID=171969 RepID=A0A9Q1QDG1_9CARY|nr:hypothetical protein Cgig2_031982 [Carnegiea gigantea]